MNTKRNSFLLVLAAFIWGVAFVAQRVGGDQVGPLSFICIRSFIGSAVLLPAIILLDKMKLTKRIPATKEEKKLLWKGGFFCGICVTLLTVFQQLGLYYGTPAGKAGFLTACYIVLVPVLGIFFHKKCAFKTWIAVAITVVGLYLLCMDGSLRIQLSDILVLICSFMGAMHIICVDYFAEKVEGVRMSCIQFFVAGMLTLIPMCFFEIHGNGGMGVWLTALSSWNAWIPLLYAGALSSGVAYTLQIIGQQGVNPALASLLMSLESVFSVLAGSVLLRERMNFREIAGCAIIFAAVLLAQMPEKNKN